MKRLKADFHSSLAPAFTTEFEATMALYAPNTPEGKLVSWRRTELFFWKEFADRLFILGDPTNTIPLHILTSYRQLAAHYFETKPASISRQQVKNHLSILNKWMRFVGKQKHDAVGDEFKGLFERTLIQLEASRTLSANSFRNYKRELLEWRDYYQAVQRTKALPRNFAKALDWLLFLAKAKEGLGPDSRLSRFTSGKLRHRIGMNTDAATISGWIKGDNFPCYRLYPCVEKLEVELEVPPGTLTSLLPKRPSHHGFRGGHVITDGYRSPSEPRTKYGRHITKLSQLKYRLPFEEWPAQVLQEWNSMYEFYTCTFLPPGLERHPKSIWRVNQDSKVCVTATIHQDLLSSFFGFLLLVPQNEDSNLRGLGWKKEDLTIALLTDPALVEAYLNFKRQRSYTGDHSHMVTSIINFICSCLAPTQGFFWQKDVVFAGHDYFSTRLPATFEYHDTPIPLPTKREKWRCWCTDNRKRFFSALKALKQTGAIKNGRDREGIEKILEMQNPLDAMYLMEEKMAYHLDNMPPSKVLSAAFHRDLFLVTFVGRYPLRLGLLNSLKTSDFRVDGKNVELVLQPERFKNYKHTASTEFRVQLQPEVAEQYLRYINFHRPLLVGGSDPSCEYVFLATRLGSKKSHQMNEKCLSRRFHDITRTYIPELTPTGFSLHAVRHILATDFIRNDIINGYKKAAIALLDCEETVHLHYAHIGAADEQRVHNENIRKRIQEYRERRAKE